MVHAGLGLIREDIAFRDGPIRQVGTDCRRADGVRVSFRALKADHKRVHIIAASTTRARVRANDTKLWGVVNIGEQ